VPKSGTVDDLVTALVKKAQLDDEAKAGPIRVYETHSNKIHRELSREHNVVSITDYIQLMAERVPEDDLEADPSMFIQAFHYHNEPSKSHGTPFKFRLVDVSPGSLTFVPAILTMSRARNSLTLRSDWRSGQESRGRTSRRSSLLWSREARIPNRHISPMVGILALDRGAY
jgi:hypothetical protein